MGYWSWIANLAIVDTVNNGHENFQHGAYASDAMDFHCFFSTVIVSLELPGCNVYSYSPFVTH